MNPAVARLPQIVVGEKQQMRVDAGEDDRLSAHGAIRRTSGRGASALPADRTDVGNLCRTSVIPCNLSAENDVRVEWVGRGVAILLDAHRMPFAKRNLSVVASTGYADGSAFLLAAANAIWKGVVRHHVVKLRRRLVVP